MPQEPRLSLTDRLTIGIAARVVRGVIANMLDSWGPNDLLIAINVDADLLRAALEHPDTVGVMRYGKTLAALFPKVEEAFAETFIFEWLRKNYPHLFMYSMNGGTPIRFLDSPEGQRWLFKQVREFREYFWPGAR